ncbi:uncharacterized protein LOC127796882 [Diospyros lotus]|uniref:uncharacterized protein LOC127796882 n=1 Tax=Diospyros lotus TaxID=55363 RepID=UPI0022580B55|nr:uncharacterized protein LOC127796882 [Diospyros lotus]
MRDGIDDHLGSIPLAVVGLFVSASALVSLCAKTARRVSRKYENDRLNNDSKLEPPPGSPLRLPGQLIKETISNKDINSFIHRGKAADEGGGDDDQSGGLWQKSILMGEKCQPPEFSGVIFYDRCGNRISELPSRSPRASPMPAPFSFPVTKDVH